METKKGGYREGSGRKKKDVEQKAQKLSLAAMEKVFGSVDECFAHTAKEAKESYPHLRLLFEYAFGKPPQTIQGELDHVMEIVRKTIK